MARPESPKTIYLDSCSIISLILKQNGWEVVQRVTELADQGKIKLVTSTLLLVEARGQGRGAPFDAQKDSQIISILDTPRWIQIELDRSVALTARRLAMRFGLSNYDAIHLASAIEAEADVLMTLDTKFARLNQTVEGVWVGLPYPPAGPDLMLQDDET